MESLMRFILAASLAVNGGLAGLIAGHMLARPAGCSCGAGCDCHGKPARDEGPFPTGWVSPEPGPVAPKPGSAKPSGAVR